MLRGLEEKNWLRGNPQCLQQGVCHARAVEKAVRYGINENPADEVGKRGNRLYKLPEGHAPQLVHKYCKQHGQPGGCQRNAAHGEGIFKDLQELLDFNRVFHQGFKPFQAYKIMDGKGLGRRENDIGLLE